MWIHLIFTPPLSQLVRFFRLTQLCAIPHNAALSVLGHIPLPVWEVSSSGFTVSVCMGQRVSVLEFDDELPGPWWNGCLRFFSFDQQCFYTFMVSSVIIWLMYIMWKDQIRVNIIFMSSSIYDFHRLENPSLFWCDFEVYKNCCL
jgi:hypothetical protein